MAKAKLKTQTKGSVKKTASKKKNVKINKNHEWESLAKELKCLIPKLDEEGLAFLVKQAQVHLYNMQVDSLNNTMIKDAQRQKSLGKKPAKTRYEGFNDVKISGTSYFIAYEGEWISLTKNEMTTLVKIALGEGIEMEIKERLFNWLTRERNDILNTCLIAGKFDDKLISLINLLKNNFKLKNQ